MRQEVLEALYLFHQCLVIWVWHSVLDRPRSCLFCCIASDCSLSCRLHLSFDAIVLGTCIELLLVESGVPYVVPFEEDSWLLQEVANGLLLHLALENVPVLVAELPVREVDVLPLSELEERCTKITEMTVLGELLGDRLMQVIGEELEGPSVHSGLLNVVVAAEGHSNSLHDLLVIRLLVDALPGGHVRDVDVVDAQTVDSLPCPLDDGALLDEELLRVVPVAALVHLQVDRHAFLLQAELVGAFL